jgi:lipopolysaccharide transport system permease protein
MHLKKDTQRLWDLFVILVEREITLKYKRTYMGFVWSLLNPILTAAVLFIAFKIFMRFEMKNYTLFLLSAMFPWNWFSSSVLMSVNSLVWNAPLIRKVIFPKHLLVLSIITGQLVTLLFSLPILAVLLYYYGGKLNAGWLIGIPILIIIQYATVTGVSLAIAMLNAFFRDMEHITGVCINMLFWLTPILYPLSVIPQKYRIILTLNPMIYLIESWRDVIMGNPINWGNMGISALTAVVFLIAGMAIFNRMTKKLDEVL